MLTTEPRVINDKDTIIPNLLVEIRSFPFQYINLTSYEEILTWTQHHNECSLVLQSGSSLSLSLRLLKLAGCFPMSSEAQMPMNYWDKRFIFVRVLVDLIAQASQQTQTHNSSYVDAVSFLLQCITDIIQYEPSSHGSSELTMLMQEILNLFNICYPSQAFVMSLCSSFLSCLSQSDNCPKICIATIKAGIFIKLFYQM
jgi:hypothetical protein